MVIEVVLEELNTNNLRNSVLNIMKKIGKLNDTPDVERFRGYINAFFNRNRTQPIISTNIPEYNKIMSIRNSILETNLSNDEKRLIKKFTNKLKDYIPIETLLALE